MYNLVLLRMGAVVFISFKNNKKILLKNIFIQKDVDLNSKKQRGFTISPSEYRATVCSSLAHFKPTPSSPVCPGHVAGSSQASGWRPLTREGMEHTPALVILWPVCPLREQASGCPSCSFRVRVSCLGFSLEDPALKGTAFTNSNQTPPRQEVEVV